MVHLSPDSRLLVSLVKHEQAYATQLHNLLNASGTSLSALAVYASSSPPTISPVLNGVASAFSGADEALRGYGEALNDWIDKLRTIKSKEEEVANIGRDREILVTRLLKVSQKAKSPPPSLLHATPDSSSNTSFPSFNSKITAAQTELQACESHLAENEHELERHRVHAIRQGLKLRCEALVQCSRVWGEMGRRALSMLEELNGIPTLANGHASEFFKPLPRPTPDHDHDSVLSSLTPSQSASQIGAMPHSASLPSHEKSYLLDIPPPHLVSEHTTIPGSSQYASGGPDYGNSSSEDDRPVEVHENPRFQPASVLNRRRSVKTAPPTPARSSPVPFPNSGGVRSASSDVGLPTSSSQGKHRRDRKSMGILGSIALLFRTSMNSKSTPAHSGGQWNTRTNHNVRSVKIDGEHSSDEEMPRLGRLRKSKVRPSPKDDVGGDSAAPENTGTTLLPMSFPTTPRIKNKTSGGKLSRSGGSSTTLEPASVPRVRANTLTSASPSGVFVDAPAQMSRGHGRTASMDGRWGLTDPGPKSTASSHRSSSTMIWKPPKQSMTTKDDSLMRIVEGVSHSNQHDDPSTRLEVVRAPINEMTGLPLLIHHPPPLPATTPASASLMQTSVAQKRSSLPNPPTSVLSRDSLSVTKKPLRSAMRDPNRDRSVSPSLSASPNGNVAEAEQQSISMSPLSLPGPASSSLRPLSISRPEIPSTIIESPRQSIVETTVPQATTQSAVSMKADDSASLSSYETGHENFDDEELESPAAPLIAPINKKGQLSPPPPPPPPPMSNVFPLNGMLGGVTSDRYEMSSATSTDTATGATTTRRKSVRMSSLPPQVSATPPALEDGDEDRSPWGGLNAKALRHDEGWKTRVSTSNVAWDDSSSEDEVYKSARKALSRVEQRLEKKTR